MSTSQCRYCDAEVEWAQNVDTGKVFPMDPSPAANGNVVVLASRDERGRRLTRTLRKGEPRPERTYLSHFVTCKGRRRARADAKVKRAPNTLFERGPF